MGDPVSTQLGALEKLIQSQAKIRANAAQAEIQKQMDTETAGQLYKLGQMKALLGFHQEAKAAQAEKQAAAAEPQPPYQTQIPAGSAMAEGPVRFGGAGASGSPQAVFDAQRMGVAQGQTPGTALQPQAQAAAPGAQGADAAMQGLPVAGPTQQTTETQTQVGLHPQADGPFRFVMLPELNQTQTTRTTPNAITAPEVARIRMEAARDAAVQERERKTALANNVRQFLQDLPPNQAIALAQKVETGTPEEISALAAQLPKPLGQKVKESQIAAENARADYYRAQAARQRALNGVTNLTEGEKKTDDAYAKVYANLATTATIPKAMSNLQQLESIAQQLDKGVPLTGGVTRLLPEGVRLLLGHLPRVASDEESINAAARVGGVIMQTAISVLGGRYTENEGLNLVRRAYDIRLSPQANAVRLRAVTGELAAQLKEQQREAEYFGATGTLKGFKRDINPALGGEGKKDPAQMTTEEIMKELGR